MSNEITRLSLPDLTNNPEIFRRRLYEGLKEYGFVILQDHDISRARLDEAYQLAQAFFDLPANVKLQYDSGSGAERGYTAFGRESAKGNVHSDLKEFWHIGPDVGPDSQYYGKYPKNVWPAEIDGFRDCFKSLYLELERMGKTMLEALGEEMGLEEAFFRDMVTDGNSICRLLHYPAVKNLDTQNSMRAAPHADINLLTLLVGATDSGLELLDPNGEWMAVESDSDDIVLDTGDMMSRLTNDVLPATVHRVVNPNKQDQSRYSMPFFLHPHSRADLDCLPQCVGAEGPKYPPITAGEFLQQRLVELGLIDADEPGAS
ncbi:MAG: 2-oxoglutarate and iron-dependent oxygenase domain-containing protein [Gammaproteobacteria bacterium]